MQRLQDAKKRMHPHSDVIDRSVKIWNELRERKTPTARKHELVAEIYGMTKGRTAELAMRHDTSRVVQGCIKYGDQKQRETICKELLGKCLDMTKSKHGHQLVEKMLLYGGPVVRQRVAGELKGHMVRLLTHNLGSVVVNTGFTKAWNHSTCWSLYQELYGSEYIHFKEQPIGAKNLTGVLKASPDKRKAIVDSMFFTLSRQADKGLLSLPIAQKLLSEYLQHAPPEQVVAMVSSLKEQILSLVASREGARSACLALHYATAKERKTMLKVLKGHMLDLACHMHGHMVLVTALEVTDDTRTSGAAIFSELSNHLPFLACHQYGKRVLLALLAPGSRRYFSAYDLSLLTPVTLPAYLVKRKDKSGDGDEDGAAAAGKKEAADGKAGKGKDTAAAATPAADGAAAAPEAKPHAPITLPAGPTAEQIADSAPTATSRKDPSMRRAELLAQIRPKLESACLTHTAVLARSKHGAVVLMEAAQVLPFLAQPQQGGGKGKKDEPAAPAASPTAINETGRRILECIAELVLHEPDSATISAQVDEMNAAAKTDSAGHKDTTDKLLTTMGPELAAAQAASSAGAGPATAAAAAVLAVGSKTKFEVSAADGEDEDMDGGDADAEEADEDGSDVDDDDDVMDEEEDEDASDDEDDVPVPAPEGGAAFVDVDGAAADEEGDDWEGEAIVLPLLEHAPSHLLFKRLLQREAVPRADGPKQKGGKDKDGADAAPAAPVFGPILYQSIKGHLIELVTSNRAAFVILELASSSDAGTATAVCTEVRKGVDALKAQEQTPGMQVLVKLVTGAVTAVVTSSTAKQAEGGKPSAAATASPVAPGAKQQPGSKQKSNGKQ